MLECILILPLIFSSFHLATARGANPHVHISKLDKARVGKGVVEVGKGVEEKVEWLSGS